MTIPLKVFRDPLQEGPVTLIEVFSALNILAKCGIQKIKVSFKAPRLYGVKGCSLAKKLLF